MREDFAVMFSFNGKDYEKLWKDLPETAQEYLAQNGFFQSLNDAHAGPGAKARSDLKLKKEDADTPEVIAAREGAILKRLDKITMGLMTAGHGGARDPLRATARLMIKSYAERENIKFSKDQFDDLVQQMLDKRPDDVKAEFLKRRAAQSKEVSIDQI